MNLLKIRRYINRRTLRFFYIGVIFFLIIICAASFLNVNFLEMAGRSETIKLLGKSLADIPYVIYGFKSTKDVPVYNIVIDKERLDELNKNLPVETFILEKKYKKTHPAKFIMGDKEYNIDVRYRGDYSNHWRFEKKSWQINFSDDYFENKKSIGLILPEDRLFFMEQLNNYRAKKMGLSSPESKFVILKVNGKSQGIYFETEDWGKEFLEKSKMAGDANFYGEDIDGGIFASIFAWKQYTSDLSHQYQNYGELDKLISLLKNPDDKEFYKEIVDLVDMDNFYRWNVHSMIAGGIHQDGWHNARLYFDNTVGKFKFIPWDVGGGKTDEQKTSLEKNVPGIDFVNYNPIAARILKKPEFLQARNKILWDYVNNGDNLKDDLEFYDGLYKKYRDAFYKDGLKRVANYFFDKSVAEHRSWIEYNFKYIKKLFKISDFNEEIHINKNYNQKDNIPIQINLLLKSYAPVSLKNIKMEIDKYINDDFYVFYDSNDDNGFDYRDNLLGELSYSKMNNGYEFKLKDTELLLYTNRKWLPNAKNAFVVLKEIQSNDLEETAHRLFILPKDRNKKVFIKEISPKIVLKNYFTGEDVKSSEIRYVDANEFSYFDGKGLTKEEFLRDNPVFIGGVDDVVILPYGNYVFNQNIIIPKDLELEIRPGTTMLFDENISLISYSPIKAIGSADAPIKITALNSNKPRGVFGIVGATKESQFRNVIFEYGGQAYINGAFFSGALAAHGSDIKIENCQFKYASGDDGLNVKNASAEISGSLFYKNNFDGLDFDSVKGKILNNKFLDNGNDGIDISGSDMGIENNDIKNSGDKCISVGEKSNPVIINNNLEGCATGIASKDLSGPIIVNNTIANNKIAISAYMKKEIFGGSFPRVGANSLKNNEKDFETDELSQIIEYKQ